MMQAVAILDSAYRGAIILRSHLYVVRPLHIMLRFLHLCTLKIGLKLHVCVLKILANAYVNISSRFSTTYFLPGGAVAPP